LAKDIIVVDGTPEGINLRCEKVQKHSNLVDLELVGLNILVQMKTMYNFGISSQLAWHVKVYETCLLHINKRNFLDISIKK